MAGPLNIAQLQRMRAGTVGDGDKPRGLPQPGGSSGADFKNTLKEAMGQVDGAQKEADAQVEAFVAGEQENLHEVMISMNQAELYLQLMTEVRNKMLETYQELMRMQV